MAGRANERVDVRDIPSSPDIAQIMVPTIDQVVAPVSVGFYYQCDGVAPAGYCRGVYSHARFGLGLKTFE